MGSLIVVGTGIAFPGQATVETLDYMKAADIVFYNVGADNLASNWIENNAKETRDLYQYYESGVSRSEAYDAMVKAIVDSVKQGNTTVAAFYGHPGVFVGPGYRAVEECRALGYTARMLPGVSAVDCMYADLEFDPANSGIVMLEATQYLVCSLEIPSTMPLILWQAGCVADTTFNASGHTQNVDLLQDVLLRHYPSDHPLVAYMASVIPGIQPSVETGTVNTLTSMDIHASHTLMLPPLHSPKIDEAAMEKMKQRQQ